MKSVEGLEWKRFSPNEEALADEEEDEGDEYEWSQLRGDKWDEL